MKVLHIQYRMPPSGNACFRLHTTMRKYGIDSKILTIEKGIKRNFVYSIPNNSSFYLNKISYYIKNKRIKQKLKPGTYFYSALPNIGNSIHNNPLVQEADVIYFHWIAGGSLSLNEIKKILDLQKLVIFFMHDMWDFTGGCHHSFDCNLYTSRCEDCPMFKNKSYAPLHQLKSKYSLYSKFNNIVFISPSDWMREKGKQSLVLKNKFVYTINNIIDENIFKPIPKDLAKKILNLPCDKKIITFGCQAGTNNPFKGWSYLKEAVNSITTNNIHIVIYGSDSNQETIDQIKFPITFLGPILDETVLSLICNATDVFVSPSLAESYGLTFMENLLCGTPVVGFDNTAISEIIVTDKTGYLAENKNYKDLAFGIDYVLSSNIKVDIRSEYSSKSLLEKHLNIISKHFKQIGHDYHLNKKVNK